VIAVEGMQTFFPTSVNDSMAVAGYYITQQGDRRIFYAMRMGPSARSWSLEAR
jgi:hypothetical protein